MYDVPYEVKRALKDGRLKKNYRIIVKSPVEKREVTPVAYIGAYYKTYFVITEDDYWLYAPQYVSTYRLQGTIIYPDSTTETVSIVVSSEEDSLVHVGVLPTGTKIDFSNYQTMHLHELTITTTENIKYVTEWVDDFTIENDTLVKESVSIDERMCSGDVLKFGLCEGSSLEFQYFDHPAITEKRIQAFVDVDYGETNPYPIPLGFFDVKKCSRQASTGIIKATCINKLQSDYLDADANELIAQIPSDTGVDGELSLYAIQAELLNGYRIETEPASEVTLRSLASTTIQGSFSFKLVGSSTTYSEPSCRCDIIECYPASPGEVMFAINDYRVKLERVLSDFKSWVTNNVQNPDTFWSNFVNSLLYQRGASVCCGLNQVNINASYFIQDSEITNYSYTYHGDIKKLEYLNNAKQIVFYMPANFGNSFTWMWSGGVNVLNPDDISVYQMPQTSVDGIVVNTELLPDVTLRELVGASYETACQFGQLDRTTDLFRGVELNYSRLYPQNTLYPENSLYPDGAAMSANRSMYSKLWADEGNVHKWRNLVIKYKGINESQQTEMMTYTLEVNQDGTDDYICDDNWLFKNLVWSDADIESYAAAMAGKMENVTWFPFEMWLAGLPYMEVGDEIEIPLGDSSYTTYILSRQLKGIQNLQDTYINGTLDIF